MLHSYQHLSSPLSAECNTIDSHVQAVSGQMEMTHFSLSEKSLNSQ